MIISLYDVLSVTGRETSVQAEIGKIQTNFQGEDLVVTGKEPIEVVLNHPEKDIVSIRFDVKVDVSRSCSRCLEDVNCEYSFSVFRNLNVAEKEAYTDNPSEADAISYIEDCNLDIDMLVLDELFTILPMNAVCKNDCKGFCKVCGINLNKSTCNCDQTVPDPRMAVFSDIFNQFKEV